MYTLPFLLVSYGRIGDFKVCDVDDPAVSNGATTELDVES